MKRYNRKTTPKVAGGLALRKNNHKLTPNYWNTEQDEIIIDVEKPGWGYKHFLKKRDIKQFIEIIPNWDILSEKLNAVVLESGHYDHDGVYYYSGVICISAWNKEQDILLRKKYYEDHQEIFDRLGVIATERKRGIFCEFNEDQIKAYQLLHIFLHELGHHYDRLQTKHKNVCARGEQFAENFAFEYEDQIWLDYQTQFNIVF